MALPRFSFSGGATDFFQPNQALFRTTFTPSDKLQSETYQAEAKAYQDAVEKYNEAIKVNPEVAPPKPTPISFTQEDFDQFGVDASRRAQQLQNAKQNAFTAITNPGGFSQQYGIGSLGFEEGGEVPVNFVGTGEFPETDSSVGYRTGPASQNKELPLAAELLVDFTPVVGDVKAGIEAADYFNKGEYGNAALAGVGVLPFVPPLVGMAKKVKGLTVDSLKRKPKPIAPDADVSKTRELIGIDDANQNSIEAWKKQRKDEIEAATGRRKIGPSLEDKLALVKQARLLDEGKISTNNFRTFVDTNFPYYFHEAVPEIKSMKENALALGTKVNKKGILGLNRFLPEGAETQIRFDVNAYENANVYTSTIYEGLEGPGKLHSYAQTGALKNVTFPVDEKLVKESKKMAGIGVDTPKDKSPVVRMKGYWVEHSPEELREIAMEALEQNKNLPLAKQEWVQVGINPAKGASWVALEKTADGVTTIPITGASEVIQIGKLVLAKNPKFKSWDNYYKTASFEEGGAVGKGVASLRPAKTTMGLAPYGIRHSGEGAKGLGYFGETTSPSGQAVTEYSLYDEDIGEYPSIVPTLTSEELQDTIRRSSQGQSPSMEVVIKARMYAKDRLSEGKSPFSDPTELRFPVPSNTDDDMLRRINAYLEKNRP